MNHPSSMMKALSVYVKKMDVAITITMMTMMMIYMGNLKNPLWPIKAQSFSTLTQAWDQGSDGSFSP